MRREAKSGLLEKEISTTESLLLAAEPLSFRALLEALWLNLGESLSGTKSCRIDWLCRRSSSLSLRS